MDVELIVGVREIVAGLGWPPQRVSDYAVGRIKNTFPVAFKTLRATALYDLGDIVEWMRANPEKVSPHAPWRALLAEDAQSVPDGSGVPDTTAEPSQALSGDPGAPDGALGSVGA